MQWPIIPIKNLTSLFPLIFLSKHICVYALGRIKWILGIIWPWNQHFNLKNIRNWKKQVWMLTFLIGIIRILLHWWKKLTLERSIESTLLQKRRCGGSTRFLPKTTFVQMEKRLSERLDAANLAGAAIIESVHCECSRYLLSPKIFWSFADFISVDEWAMNSTPNKISA